MGEDRKKITGRWRQAASALAIACLLAAMPTPSARAQVCPTCVAVGIQDAAYTGPMAVITSMLEIIDDLYMPLIIEALTGYIPAAYTPIPGGAGVIPVGFVPVIPAIGIDADLNNGFQQINAGLNMIASQVLPRHAQMGADATKAYKDSQGQANESVKAVVAPQSTHCAMTQANQLRSALDGVVSALARGYMSIVIRRNGAAATQPGIGLAAQRLCEIAPFLAQSPRLTPATAAAIGNCAQSDAQNGAAALPAYLIDGHQDEGNVFDKLQFEIPDSVQMTPNGHVRFTPADDTQWEFVAAWRYCERYIPDTAPPPSITTTTSISDVQRIVVDRNVSVAKNIAAIGACMHAIAYRTACPQTSQGDFAGAGAGSGNCWQIQNLACYRLKDQPPSGLGITTTGDSDADYALANCDDDGLSPAMYDYILAHRCSDTNYTMGAVAQDTADATQASKVHAVCEKRIQEFKDHVAKEKEAFDTARESFASSY